MDGQQVSRCLAGQKLLLAEDGRGQSQCLVNALSERGAEVVGPVSTVEEGLAIVESGRALNGALIDLYLHGECSFPLAAALLQRELPVAFATAAPQPNIPRQFSGVPLFQRPCTIESVTEVFAHKPTNIGLAQRNRFLAELGPDDRADIVRSGRVVVLPRGPVHYGRSEPYCSYFLFEGVASLLMTDSKRQSSEVAMIGAEGVVNLPSVVGRRSSLHLIMTVPGRAIAIECEALERIARARPAVANALEREVSRLARTIARSALTAARYPTQARVARWLLMLSDRMGGGELPVTHAQIAALLGVRRASVSTALKQMRILETDRGSISIIDAMELERLSVGCYDGADFMDRDQRNC